MRRLAPLAAAAALALWAAPARADDHRRALELFRQGEALAEQGRCAEAIPKLTDTLAIEPSVGALLNLGQCRERTGEPELAWKRFREAEALAHRLGDDREPFARARAEALEPRLPKLEVDPPRGARGGLVLRVDGEELAPSEWGVARAVVTGPHVVSASVPGRPPWQTTVVTAGRATSTVAVPPFVAEARPREHVEPRGSARRVAGVAVGAAGAAGLVFASVFGGVAIARKSDAAALATGPSQADFDAAKADASAWATASTVTFIVSGVALAAGAVLWLTAPSRAVSVAACPSPSGAWLSVQGRF